MAGKGGKSGRKRGKSAGTPKTGGTDVYRRPGRAPEEDLVDMKEAVALLKTTRATFYRWLRSGKVKGMKVGRQWRFRREEIQRFLEGAPARADLPSGVGRLLDDLSARLAASGIPDVDPDAFVGDISDARRAIVMMVSLGAAMRASALHLTTHVANGEAETWIRCRIDGVLHPVIEVENRLVAGIVEEWKHMAGCNPQERAKPQDGRLMLKASVFHTALPDRKLDGRINFLPAALAEAVTVRILDPGAELIGLDGIDYAPEDRRRLDRALAAPWGVILITGPAGCGKTTSLYAALGQISRPQDKIMTVEDPVEYYLPWATQIQLKPSAGVTMATAMKAVMRSDPDIIMMGEAANAEAIQLAQTAAVTGHLVLTTLHTADAAGALMRMVDMGSDPFLVAESTRVILAQRLIRKVCPHCGVAAEADPNVYAHVARCAREGGIDPESVKHDFRKAVGCEKCGWTGYKGRTVVAETLEFTGELGLALRAGADAAALQALAVEGGMTTMAADGLRRAAAGETTLEEIMRVAT